VCLNKVFDVPYVADFTQDAVGGLFTQIDANDDGSFWEWDGGIRATYSYNSDNVTAVYANGQESRPATATLTATVGISGLTANAPNGPTTVYSLDGKRVSHRINSLKGTFIINNKKVTLK
jgi:hypothetical protein